MGDFDKVQQWLYEQGKLPLSVQPEQHLFDVIIEVTYGDDPTLIIRDLEEAKMHRNTIERFKDYFISKAIRDSKLKSLLFGE